MIEPREIPQLFQLQFLLDEVMMNVATAPVGQPCDEAKSKKLRPLRLSHEQLKVYLDAQVEEILKYKWIESERHCNDIGFHRAAMEWSDRYGSTFRQYWLTQRIAF